MTMEFFRSECIILKVKGLSGCKQLQISFLAKSTHVLFSVSLSPQYFETDDPEFYKSKVCFILNNDMSEMELVFAEEKYNKSGQLDKVKKRTEACASHFPASSIAGLSTRTFCNDGNVLYLCCLLSSQNVVGWDQITEFLNNHM